MKLVSCYLGIDFDLKREFDWSLGRVRKIIRKPLIHFIVWDNQNTVKVLF